MSKLTLRLLRLLDRILLLDCAKASLVRPQALRSVLGPEDIFAIYLFNDGNLAHVFRLLVQGALKFGFTLALRALLIPDLLRIVAEHSSVKDLIAHWAFRHHLTEFGSLVEQVSDSPELQCLLLLYLCLWLDYLKGVFDRKPYVSAPGISFSGGGAYTPLQDS